MVFHYRAARVRIPNTESPPGTGNFPLWEVLFPSGLVTHLPSAGQREPSGPDMTFPWQDGEAAPCRACSASRLRILFDLWGTGNADEPYRFRRIHRTRNWKADRRRKWSSKHPKTRPITDHGTERRNRKDPVAPNRPPCPLSLAGRSTDDRSPPRIGPHSATRVASS